MFYMD